MDVSSSLDVSFSYHACYVASRESCRIMRDIMCVGGAASSGRKVVDDESKVAQTRVMHR